MGPPPVPSSFRRPGSQSRVDSSAVTGHSSSSSGGGSNHLQPSLPQQPPEFVTPSRSTLQKQWPAPCQQHGFGLQQSVSEATAVEMPIETVQAGELEPMQQ